MEGQPKQWHEFDIPTLYTPINSIEILKQKRLTVVVQLYEKNKTKHENFAYINLHMDGLQAIQRDNQQTGETSEAYELLKYDVNVISSNRVIGKF